MSHSSRKKKGSTRPKQRVLLTGDLHIGSHGSGTVKTAEGMFLVPEKQIGPAMNGDRVQLRRLGGSHDGMPLAAVAQVTERAVTTFAARYRDDGHLRVLMPLDDRLAHDFMLDEADRTPQKLGIDDGALVCARILSYPSCHSAGIATIERVLDDSARITLAIEIIIAEHDLAVEFPAPVLKEARGLKYNTSVWQADPGRRDLRDRFVVTIDPADARDFDDALSIEERPGGGWDLGVHIADVSAYVPEGSAIDLCARERGTSVYLADRVLPMLPEELSCDLCSLRPGEDRLTMTVDMQLDSQGRLLGTPKVYPSIIRSSARCTYDWVDALLAGDTPCTLPELAENSAYCTPEQFQPFFTELDALRRLRQKIRRERGAITFITTEAKAVLDADKRPVDVTLRRPTPATELVEEAMLLANESVARLLDSSDVPAAFRVHEPPSRDSLSALALTLSDMGCLEGADVAGLIAGDPYVIQAILDSMRGKPDEELVSSLILRSMKKAEYLPTDNGHYGLGAPSYCHFTSPIRRYPDLIVHRSLKILLAHKSDTKQLEQRAADMGGWCRHSSEMERIAASADSQSQRAMLTEYLSDHIGETFGGIISAVHEFGLIVRLIDVGAEGLVPTHSLGEGHWSFNAERYELANDETGQLYRLGQSLDVVVRSTDTVHRRVVFSLPCP